MRIFQYDEIVTPNILNVIKSEVEIMSTLMDRNAWIGLHDQPDNAIEQFILDSYDFHFSDKCNNVVGFEWWIHVVEKSNHMILFHADHDEHLRVTENEMKYPMLGTCLYLDENSNPTIFLDTQHTSKYEKQIEPFPPTNAVFSYADEGKFLVYDKKEDRQMHLGDIMIREHLAVKYEGQSKEDIAEQHIKNRELCCLPEKE